MKKRPHSPDRICLSHSHDSDYEDQMDKLSDSNRERNGKTAVTAALVGEGTAEETLVCEATSIVHTVL